VTGLADQGAIAGIGATGYSWGEDICCSWLGGEVEEADSAAAAVPRFG
jgi:hypothetical protein